MTDSCKFCGGRTDQPVACCEEDLRLVLSLTQEPTYPDSKKPPHQ